MSQHAIVQQQLPLNTDLDLSQSKLHLKEETIQVEVNLDDAEWSTEWELQISKYPTKKSEYQTHMKDSRYMMIKQEMKKEKDRRSPANGWKYRVVKRTYATIHVKKHVKTEILK